MKALRMEAYRQKELYNQVLADEWVLAEDPAGLEEYVGQVVEVEVICESHTDSLLAKLYITGTEHIEHAFMLVPVWQIVKYNHLIPQPGDVFTGSFIVGVRRILKDQTYVFTL